MPTSQSIWKSEFGFINFPEKSFIQINQQAHLFTLTDSALP